MDFNFEKYKGLIFDLDGTLINSLPFHIKAWQMAGEECGIKITPDDIYATTGSSGLDIAAYLKRKYHKDFDELKLMNRKIDLYKQYVDKVETFSAVEELLKKAHAMGIKIAIGTGSRRVNAQAVLINKGLMPLIDVLVSAEDVTKHKPDPQTFSEAAARMGLSAADCLVFEDGALGIKAALNGGFDCVEVRHNEFIAVHRV